MTTVAEQVQYESRLRFRFAVIAFAAAVLLVVSQLLQMSGSKPPVSEETVDLISYNARATVDIIGSAVDMVGLIGMAALLFWLHRSAQARTPQLRSATRWVASGGAVLAGVMALVYAIIVLGKVHQFVTTGDQGYPEAQRMFSSTGALFLGQLLLELGNLLLAVGTVLVALSVMRVGLVPRIVGYAGVVAGALFIFGVPIITPLIQGFFLAGTAVMLARRWPSGDPPAWESGVAVPWPPTQRQQAQQERAGQRSRQRGGRRRVSDKDVLKAVEKNETPPNPQAGRSKRKRRK
jgi:hypothetical protein